MASRWMISPGGLRGTSAPRGGVVLTTGPLAVDPTRQAFVGVLVENSHRRTVVVGIRLFDEDVCPKQLVVDTSVSLDPGCAAGIAFNNPGFFYEAQVVLPRRREILTTIYGLGADFSLVAANTLHPRQLVEA